MNPNGVIFQVNQREWFYIVDRETAAHHKASMEADFQQMDLQDVYGPFPNSLIANTHMSNCHFTKGCRLIYQEDLQRFFAEEWNDIQRKITHSRAHPQHSTPRGKKYSVGKF